MGISRSNYYDAPVSALDDTAIVETIASICDEFEHYGWRRVQVALRQQGTIVNHKKIKRLMREHGLQPRRQRRYVATTDTSYQLAGAVHPRQLEQVRECLRVNERKRLQLSDASISPLFGWLATVESDNAFRSAL
jgi:hypothetical protein